jgi:transposase
MPVADDGGMSGSSPRAGGPSRRRSFTPTEKLEHVLAYEAACEKSQGGAYLRQQGLYSSLIFEWRRLRDAGLLEGKDPGAALGRPSAEQAEIARLRRQLADSQRRLATTETALSIMGKAHALLEQISESADTERPQRRR